MKISTQISGRNPFPLFKALHIQKYNEGMKNEFLGKTV